MELRRRVVLWKEDFFRLAPPEGGSDYLFLCNDFILEIEDYLYPYLHRLRVTDHIDQKELDAFMEFCYQQVYELRDFLTKNEEPPGNDDANQ